MAQTKDMANYIYDTLREQILSMDIKPGQELSEQILCKEFSASRTPVRTALQRLQDAELVDIIPYQYTRASLISLSKARQMIYLRSVFEAHILQDFTDKSDDFLLEDIEHLIRRQEILIKGDFKAEDFYKLDTEFHELFFKATGNEYIWSLIQGSVNYTRLRMLDIVEKGDFKTIVEEHKMLSAMIREKRKEEIPAIIERHLKGGLVRILGNDDPEMKAFLVE